jgi:hypothetical protein
MVSGLRNKEYIVYSLFEADRMIEQIRAQSTASHELELHFKLNYTENEKPRSYRGIFRYAGKTGPLSLQQHILNFFEDFSDRLDVLKITPEAFSKLRNNMVQLFDSCATEQMFSINRKAAFTK